MQVTATKSVSFPTLNWGINAGDTRDLPSDKGAQELILSHSAIKEVKKDTSIKKNHPTQWRKPAAHR
jgi:hypothetical protein